MIEQQRFLLVASQRTGSNLLNSLLNTYEGIACHGEIFNPSFVGLLPEYHEKFGIARDDTAKRDVDIDGFIERIWSETESPIIGFHVFPRQRPQAVTRLLADPSVKKILLRRSLFHSWVSLEIALQTDVWRITAHKADTKERVEKQRTKVRFDPKNFENYRHRLNGFWAEVFAILNQTKQKAHPIWYAGLSDVNKVNEVAVFIGSPEQKQFIKATTARQNPHSLMDKVDNYDELVAYADSVGLSHLL